MGVNIGTREGGNAVVFVWGEGVSTIPSFGIRVEIMSKKDYKFGNGLRGAN